MVRWALPQPSGSESQSWTYLRFEDAETYLDFNYQLYSALLCHKRASLVVEQRLSDVAYANPSKFTTYCRRYLGASYFDEIPESEYDEEEPSQSLEDSETDGGGDNRGVDYEVNAEPSGPGSRDEMDDEFGGPQYHCMEESETDWEERA